MGGWRYDELPQQALPTFKRMACSKQRRHNGLRAYDPQGHLGIVQTQFNSVVVDHSSRTIYGTCMNAWELATELAQDIALLSSRDS